jgi:putative redox protein
MSDKFYVKHEGGTRFTATTGDYTVVTGKGDPDTGQDGMTPGQLFVAALGMCIGVTLRAYCENHDIPYKGMSIEIERENSEDGRRLKLVKTKVDMPARLSDKDLQVLNRVAHRCYVGQSISSGADMEIDVSISGE